MYVSEIRKEAKLRRAHSIENASVSRQWRPDRDDDDDGLFSAGLSYIDRLLQKQSITWRRLHRSKQQAEYACRRNGMNGGEEGSAR
jgi:hypothetical protein